MSLCRPYKMIVHTTCIIYIANTPKHSCRLRAPPPPPPPPLGIISAYNMHQFARTNLIHLHHIYLCTTASTANIASPLPPKAMTTSLDHQVRLYESALSINSINKCMTLPWWHCHHKLMGIVNIIIAKPSRPHSPS